MTGEREQLVFVYGALDRMHGSRGWHWWPDGEPFEVVVGAILVQNTSWTNVEKALTALREAGALEPPRMAEFDLGSLESLIRSSGQYRQKARKLRSFLGLLEAHGGLPQLLSLPPEHLRQALLATWGIGPETADAIILYAARRPSFVIDAYTLRLFGRLQLGPGGSRYGTWKDYFETELAVADESGRRDLWARYHALVVMHCKHTCRKRAPLCGGCGLREICPASESS